MSAHVLARRLALLSLAVAALLAYGAPAVAAAGPPVVTVTAPEHARFGSSIVFGGHTASAAQRVYVHFRPLGRRGYSVTGPARSGDGAHAYRVALPFPLGYDLAYYATSDGVATKVHTLRVDRTSCTVSGPAFAKLPSGRDTFGQSGFAGFTVTRGSVWAGVSITAARFEVIRWSAAHGLHVLASYDYEQRAPYSPGLPGSVNVVGITPSGSVVAAVENPDGDGNASSGEVWTSSGARHQLRARSGWDVVQPVGVADDGTIFGWAHNSHSGSGSLVGWANSLAAPQVLASYRALYPPVVDARGDLFYDAGGQSHVRLASGQFRHTVDSDGDRANIVQAAGHWGWAAQAFGGVERFDVDHVPASGPLVGVPVASTPGWVDGAGRYGDVILDDGSEDTATFTPHYLLTRDRRYASIPPRDQRSNQQAVSYTGTVAFTSAVDHLPHFLTC